MNICVPSACSMLMEAREDIRYSRTMVLSHYVGAGNLTQFLCRNKCFQMLSHFSSSKSSCLWWSGFAFHYFLPIFLQRAFISFICYNLLILGKVNVLENFVSGNVLRLILYVVSFVLPGSWRLTHNFKINFRFLNQCEFGILTVKALPEQT